MGTPVDLPIEHQARVSISLAMRLHAEGRVDEANAIFETLKRQMRSAGPVAVLISGDARDTGVEALLAAVQACTEEAGGTVPEDEV